MKYIYYTIFVFYDRVIKINFWGDTPTHYCNAVLALFQTLMLNSIISWLLIKYARIKPISFHPLVFFVIAVIFYFLNREHFVPREKKFLKEISKKTRQEKYQIVVLSLIIIICLIWFFFYTGNIVRAHNLS